MENKFVTRRKIKHSDSHFDIEELRTDENGNQVWAVTFCSEEKMNGYTESIDLETRVNNLFAQIPQEYHIRAVTECYGEDDHDFERKLTAYVLHRVWETYDHPVNEAEFVDGFCDERLKPENEMCIIDPRTEAEKAADADWEDEQDTIRSIYKDLGVW